MQSLHRLNFLMPLPNYQVGRSAPSLSRVTLYVKYFSSQMLVIDKPIGSHHSLLCFFVFVLFANPYSVWISPLQSVLTIAEPWDERDGFE